MVQWPGWLDRSSGSEPGRRQVEIRYAQVDKAQQEAGLWVARDEGGARDTRGAGVSASRHAGGGWRPGECPQRRCPEQSWENCGTQTVPESVPPIGLAINTLSVPGAGKGRIGQIEINGNHLPDTADTNGIHITVIRRLASGTSKRGEIVQCGTAPRTVDGVKRLKSIVSDWQRVAPDGFLTLISGTQGVDGSAAVDELSQLATMLGLSRFTTANRQWLQGSHPFSFVGAAGWDAGAGYSNLGATGALVGYLQPNPATTALGFALGDYSTFNTRATGGPLTNTMLLNNKSLTATLPATVSGDAVTAGFQVVVVDRRTLGVVVNRGFPTNCVQAPSHFCPDISLQYALYTFLAGERTKSDDLVMVQSIGHPHPTTPNWNGIANDVVDLGELAGSSIRSTATRVATRSSPCQAFRARQRCPSFQARPWNR